MLFFPKYGTNGVCAASEPHAPVTRGDQKQERSDRDTGDAHAHSGTSGESSETGGNAVGSSAGSYRDVAAPANADPVDLPVRPSVMSSRRCRADPGRRQVRGQLVTCTTSTIARRDLSSVRRESRLAGRTALGQGPVLDGLNRAEVRALQPTCNAVPAPSSSRCVTIARNNRRRAGFTLTGATR